MDVIERIKPLCYTGEDRPTIASPFRMEWDGGRWAAATDGHALVAIPFDGEIRTDGPDAVVILQSEPKPTKRVRVAALREWAGNPWPTEDVCPVCKGEPPRLGYCPSHQTGRFCGKCDSLGRMTERLREGLILEGGLNRILLARVLTTLPEGTNVIAIGQAGKLNPYILAADGWISAVMPMNGLNDTHPRFHIAEAA